MPDSMRDQLVMPFGRLMNQEEATSTLRQADRSVTVGDVVALTMLEQGLQPDIMVYDLRTERHDMRELAAKLPYLPGRERHVKNPAGRIMPGLVRAIEKALASRQKVKLMVEGEEDLASLVIAALAPDGTQLLYGLPKKGIVSVNVDEEVRAKARELIESMEECN